MAANMQETYVEKLHNYCTTNQIAQPQFQDYSDPRGIRTAWSSGVIVQGREFRAQLWRDYRYLAQSREEAAEIAWKTLNGIPVTNAPQYAYGQNYTSR